MTSRRRATDRRLTPRFEVVGDLRGTLELVRPLRLLNVGLGGALVQSDRRWDIGSVHSIVVANGVEVGQAQICVRHIHSKAEDAAGPYLIGVEFLSLTAPLAAEISKWAVSGDRAPGEAL